MDDPPMKNMTMPFDGKRIICCGCEMILDA